jgi:FKBP-type peptidyl-prolyl cis-trans isomerase FkpA
MKMNMWVVMLVAISIAFTSCTNSSNKDFTVTKTGLGYKIFSGGGKDSLKPGSFVRFRLVQKIQDSLLTIPDETPDQFGKIDSVPREFDLWEIANKLAVGDSVVYRLPVDTIFKKSPNAPPGSFPDYLKKGTNIYIYIKLLKRYDSVQVVQEEYRAEMMRMQQQVADKRKAEVEKIAKEKFAGAVKTAGGSYVKITQEGNGPTCDSGKVVSMKYEGRYPDGRVFDGNMNNKDTARNKPVDFSLTPIGLIHGWYEGLQLLKKGSKANILVPYDQAYGASGYQDVPPYSNLLFEVEVVDIKEAPKQISIPGSVQGMDDPRIKL